MNFALALTGGKVRGIRVDTGQLVGENPPAADPTATLSTLEAKLLVADVSRQTHESIMAQISQPASVENKSKPAPTKLSDAGTMAGLLLGSPEFQRR
jgi:signal recognition particle GTPase